MKGKKMVYCIDCDQEVLATITEKEEQYTVKGDGPFSIRARVPVCPRCGAELFDEEIETENQKKLYGQYRRKHGLLLPEEIKAIRERYGLTQKSFSRLLGFGEVTIHRYESGSIQDKAHDTVIRNAQNPRFIQELYQKNPQAVSARERKILEKKLETLLSENAQTDFWDRPDLSQVRKVTTTILFLAHAVSKLSREKLYFLLWYADMLHHKEFGTTITGLRYEKHSSGPVPYCFDVFLRSARSEGAIEIKEEVHSPWNYSSFPAQQFAAFIMQKPGESLLDDLQEISQTRIYPRKDADTSSLSPSELRVLRFVAQTLGHCRISELTQRIKREKAFLETKEQEFILFYLARDLTLSLPPDEKPL